MIWKIVKLITMALLLMAFQCEEEYERKLKYDEYKVHITPSSSFSLDDTICIRGKVSSHVYDVSINDSTLFNGKY